MSEAVTKMDRSEPELTASSTFDLAEKAANFIRSRYADTPQVALILGSGLGAFADEISDGVGIPYDQIPGFARSTVEGHAGRLVLGKVGGVHVAAMQGRFHFYEGYPLSQVIFPVRTLGVLGVKSLIVTNAAGGVNIEFNPGALMLINDHLNLMGVNPLIGHNDARFGPRFPDMTEVYTHRYQEIAVEEATAMNLHLKRGVYAALTGPSYETPAEIRLLRTLGADAIGMSTVPEAIVARQMGINVLGISCITNMAAGVVEQNIDHAEVLEIGLQVREVFQELLRRVIPRLD
jgi:purine-nucleoside phosphorylase